MKKLLAVLLFCCILIIAAFLLFGDIEKWVVVNLNTSQSKLVYTFLSFGLLTADIFLPVPSSVIMILNGKVLGIFFGTLVSFVSGLLSSIIGFFIGRKTNSYVDKFFSTRERETSNRLFSKFGQAAITISKALPILSEAVSFVSGTTAISFRTFLTYSIIGHCVVALLYACIGNLSDSSYSTGLTAVIILSALVTGWIIQIVVSRKAAENKFTR